MSLLSMRTALHADGDPEAIAEWAHVLYLAAWTAALLTFLVWVIR